jgi:hypothetical protein
MKRNGMILAVVVAACAVGTAAVVAQNKVQGVKWRAKVTMQAKSFAMPERTMEVCLPPTDPEAAAAQQGQQQANCKMGAVKRVGNKTSADMKCTGDRPSETHWEMENRGDTMAGTMVTKTASDTITVKYDYTKLGAACEVPQAPAAGAMPQGGTPEERQKLLQELMKGSR